MENIGRVPFFLDETNILPIGAEQTSLISDLLCWVFSVKFYLRWILFNRYSWKKPVRKRSQKGSEKTVFGLYKPTMTKSFESYKKTEARGF